MLNQFFKHLFLKKKYLQSLKKQSILIKELKNTNYKLIDHSLTKEKYKALVNDNIIMYIIDIIFSRSNTFLTITNSIGQLKFYASAGHLNFKGKSKKSRSNVLKSIYQLLSTKLSFLKGKPIALHLKNVGFKRFSIIQKLKTKFFIKSIKIFNVFPFNGCRKKKVKRKKFKKK